MPEYLAPGVYVEETSFRPKTIEGVSTSTAGFVGPTRFGPFYGEPELLTSFSDFERIYGGLDRLDFSDAGEMDNYLAHGVRAFFEEGGSRLYVMRVYNDDGTDRRARHDLTSEITVRARYPGAAGNATVSFTFRLGKNMLASAPADPADPLGPTITTLRGAREYDVVWVSDVDSPIASPLAAGGAFYVVSREFNPNTGRYDYELEGSGGETLLLDSLDPSRDSDDRVQPLTVAVTVGPLGKFDSPNTWENVAIDPRHPESLSEIFAPNPADLLAETPLPRRTELYVPVEFDTDIANGAQLAEALLAQPSLRDEMQTVRDYIADADSGDAARTFRILLTQGTDGPRPTAAVYGGDERDDGRKSGVRAFEDLENISIVAAPGSTAPSDGYDDQLEANVRVLISHAERMRYRIAVVDTPPNQLVSEVLDFRGQYDSKYAALYFPWVILLDPVTENEINVPPSGHIAGIYARNDVEFGVHKAPANEVVRLAQGFGILLNKAQRDVLNPEGINCFRFFPGRGYRLWGARTMTSDPEWKYVNLRRYFAYLERSIDRGTQWAIFENNGRRLWDNVRRTVQDFLYNEWSNGRLMGNTPEEAYFVRCDRSTMTQNDIDNGRLICLIGVAPLRPAEFVIFRIGQKLLEMTA